MIFECARAKMARKWWDLLHRSCWVTLETLHTSPGMEVPLIWSLLLGAPGNWTYISEKFYYSSNEENYYNFIEAKEHCNKSGGKLAEPQDLTINSAITNHFNGFLFMSHWIGIKGGLILEGVFNLPPSSKTYAKYTFSLVNATFGSWKKSC